MNDEADQPTRRLILMYAPADGRAGFAALLALDIALGRLLRSTREPALRQLRLAWWRESLPKLDVALAPAEPVLQGLAAHVLPRGVSGASLVPIVHGWEVLVEAERLDLEALQRFAAGRGSVFASAGAVMSARCGDPLDAAGRAWALADLAEHLSTPEEAEAARALARPLFAKALQHSWSRNARALGAMTHLAQMELENGSSPIGKIGRLLWHRLSGR